MPLADFDRYRVPSGDARRYWERAGFGRMRCTVCGVEISENYMARKSHMRSRAHKEKFAALGGQEIGP